MSVPTQRSGWAQPVIQVDDDGNALTPVGLIMYGFVNGTSTTIAARLGKYVGMPVPGC